MQHDEAYETKLRIERAFAELALPSLLVDGASGLADAAAGSSAQARPWDRAMYAERVRSFTVDRWFDMPHSMSPLRCALYGWRSCAPGELICDTCGAVLVARLAHGASWDDADTQRSFAQRICTEHRPSCPWIENPSPQLFTRPVVRSGGPCDYGTVIDSLRALAMLPRLCEDWLGVPAREETLVDRMLATLKLRGAMARRAVVLALTGWSPDTALAGALTCLVCQRLVGAWNFDCSLDTQPDAAAAAGEPQSPSAIGQKRPRSPAADDENSRPAKRSTNEAVPRGPMHPVQEHRWFCCFAEANFAVAHALGNEQESQLRSPADVKSLLERSVLPRAALLREIRARGADVSSP